MRLVGSSSVGRTADLEALGLAAPAGAPKSTSAPRRESSASALPTNLAKASTGPLADKYTTATVGR
jgi:polar amino acid transport system substrate-binding protein